ncbi:MAG: pirin family protein [Clostridiales bacterium]|jgi:redox-sensitive bicupin YhaK (pirin superfamily)|nr:pirin family protein [Clostridiales bacterium]MDR2750380.1 pirin family protein [Clostridiales bacterium]
MIKHIDHNKMGRGVHGWLDSHFHFSFAEYYNPANMSFGSLRVVNDDMVKPGTGFDTHPHRDMEIISYVVQGELTHADSMGNSNTLGRGQVQYMTAGTGVLHSEHNFGRGMLRFLQIWIEPNQLGRAPSYGDFKFNWEDRVGRWMPIATGSAENPAPIRLHADTNIYASVISEGESLEFKIYPGRQAYLVLVEGKASIGRHKLDEKDALEAVEEDINITADQGSSAHFLILEMKRSPERERDRYAEEEEELELFRG